MYKYIITYKRKSLLAKVEGQCEVNTLKEVKEKIYKLQNDNYWKVTNIRIYTLKEITESILK